MIDAFDTYYIYYIKEEDAWVVCDLMITNEERFKQFLPVTLAQNVTPELSKLFV